MLSKAFKGFDVFKSEGFRVQGMNGFNGYKRSTGFRISRDSGFPVLSGAFKGVDISIIQKFQGSRDGGFQGFKVQALEGERAPRFS